MAFFVIIPPLFHSNAPLPPHSTLQEREVLPPHGHGQRKRKVTTTRLFLFLLVHCEMVPKQGSSYVAITKRTYLIQSTYQKRHAIDQGACR